MICAFDGNSMLTALRRLCGQTVIGPTGVHDQSMARMRAPISPPPARYSSANAALSLFVTGRDAPPGKGHINLRQPNACGARQSTCLALERNSDVARSAALRIGRVVDGLSAVRRRPLRWSQRAAGLEARALGVEQWTALTGMLFRTLVRHFGGRATRRVGHGGSPIGSHVGEQSPCRTSVARGAHRKPGAREAGAAARNDAAG